MFNISPIKSSSRKILHPTITPSTSLSPTKKEEKKSLEDRVTNHAYTRILLARERFNAISNTYPSNLPLSDKVLVEIHGAYLQGLRAKKGGFHAAHMTGEAGLHDNIRKMMIALIIQEKKVPAEIQIVLEAKGFKDADYKKLEKEKYKEECVREVFDSRWKKGASLLTGTEFDDTLNSTNDLPRDLNLYCDGKLEKNKTRPTLVPELSKEVILGKLDPWEATQKYQKEVRDFLYHGAFKNNERVTALTNLYQITKTCFEYEVSHSSKKTISDIDGLELYVENIQIALDIIKDLSESSDYCIGINLEKTKKFFKPLKKIDDKTKFRTIKRIWKKNHPNLTTLSKSGIGAEICKAKVRIEKIYEYFNWEFCGSRLPENSKFFHHKGYDKENDHLNTPNKLQRVDSQKRILRPLKKRKTRKNLGFTSNS